MTLKKQFGPLDPKIDLVFKRLFGDERNKPLLLSFLNGIWEADGRPPITSIEIMNSDFLIGHRNDKHPVMDLKVRDSEKNLFNVEMQVASEPYFANRALYYWSRLCATQLEEGELYDQLRPVYSIILTNFLLFARERERYHFCFTLQEQEEHFPLTDMLAIHFIELPRFDIKPEEAHTLFEKWLCFFKEGTMLEQDLIEKWREETPEIKKAIEELKQLGGNESFRWEVEERREGIRRWLTGMEDAFSRGLKKGIQDGIQEGIEKGLQEGIEKGLQDGKKLGQLESATTLLTSGMELSKVAELLNLSEEEIQTFLKKQK